MINEDVRAAIETELRKGEVLLWADKPTSGPYFFPVFGGFMFLLFGAVFLLPMARAIITGDASQLKFTYNDVPASSISNTGEFIVLLIVLTFMLLGFFFYTVYEFLRYKKSNYAVTDHRILISQEMWPKRVKTIYLQGDISIIQNGTDSVGTITFMNPNFSFIMRLFAPQNSYLHPRFLKIRNSREVELLIHQTFFTKETTP